MHWLIAVSSGHGVFDDVERISSEATQPLCYVLSFDAGNYSSCFDINKWLIYYPPLGTTYRQLYMVLCCMLWVCARVQKNPFFGFYCACSPERQQLSRRQTTASTTPLASSTPTHPLQDSSVDA